MKKRLGMNCNYNAVATRLALFAILLSAFLMQAQSDPLPAWNDGPAKQAIVNLVRATTDPSSPTFVPIDRRFATFDQDGTTWVEHPMYTQMVFAFDRVVQLAPQHPEWKTTEPFKSLIAGDKGDTLTSQNGTTWQSVTTGATKDELQKQIVEDIYKLAKSIYDEIFK